MMYNTKLNEFELRHIELLLPVIQEKIDTLVGTLNRIEKWEPSQLKHDIYLQTDADLTDFILWKVQLENAKSDINEMNKINVG